jgi:putative ABC transport system ATP-binding protein
MATDSDHETQGIAVDVKAVGFAFGEGAARKPVLNHIDFTLARGEFVILTGHSGAGKTTLLTLVGALRSVQQGSIKVLGTELAGLAPAAQRDLRRRIGFIFQDHNLFDALTAFQTLRLAMELSDAPPQRDEALARATALTAQLGMDKHLDARPGELSTGQKQRIAVARALINDPLLILADEPTASLDQHASHLVIDLIRQRIAARGASVLMVTHDNRIFSAADRIVNMVDGRVKTS